MFLCQLCSLSTLIVVNFVRRQLCLFSTLFVVNFVGCQICLLPTLSVVNFVHRQLCSPSTLLVVNFVCSATDGLSTHVSSSTRVQTWELLSFFGKQPNQQLPVRSDKMMGGGAPPMSIRLLLKSPDNAVVKVHTSDSVA